MRYTKPRLFYFTVLNVCTEAVVSQERRKFSISSSEFLVLPFGIAVIALVTQSISRVNVPRLVGRLGSGVQVRAGFQIFGGYISTRFDYRGNGRDAYGKGSRMWFMDYSIHGRFATLPVRHLDVSPRTCSRLPGAIETFS